MIKCYIVQNIEVPCGLGIFNENGFYVAKISNNNINTIAVLDDKGNWTPFKWKGSLQSDAFVRYFDVWNVFFVKNKKELNEYIPTTKFYK